MIEIQLTKGKKTIIDDEDYDIVSKYSWYAQNYAHKGYTPCYHARTDINRKKVLMHRLIMNPKPDQNIDHINGDGLDNRKRNLRIATVQQNGFNRKKDTGHKKDVCSSKFKGVTKRKNNRWETTIRIQGKYVYLGCYKTEVEAGRVYDSEAKKLFGEFARLNFPIN